MTEIALIEASFSDAIGIIASAAELAEQTRRHWASSLRQYAKAVDKPLEVIPARYSAVRAEMAALHQAPAGLTVKTLQNHKSNVKSALLWLAREKDIPAHGAPLSQAWQSLRTGPDDPTNRMRLSSLMRFCSANGIEPRQVDEAVVDRFMAYRLQVGKKADEASRRLMVRAWNDNVGQIPIWPAQRLFEPANKTRIEVAWECFPERLRREIDEFLKGLTRIRRSPKNRRIAPLKASTIKTRQAELKAAARMAVKAGVPIVELDSLAALLAPAVAEKVLDAYWTRNGDNPALFTIELANRFVAIARETKCLDEEACERLDEMRRDLEEHRTGGLTDKNIALIRQVLTPGVWERVIRLPFDLMAEARRQGHAPVRSAVIAQLAVAIAILAVAPVRLANLASIRLGFNLIKPNGPDSNYWLSFPDYDVKNRMKLNYPLQGYLTELIDEYVHDFRPTLLRGSNQDWLFPGQHGGAKGKIAFSGQITDRIYKATGLRMTVHQFRHAAAATILKSRPGQFELVRLLLGHKSLQTTFNAYIGLQTIHASEIFGEIVKEHLDEALIAGSRAGKRSRGGRKP